MYLASRLMNETSFGARTFVCQANSTGMQRPFVFAWGVILVAFAGGMALLYVVFMDVMKDWKANDPEFSDEGFMILSQQLLEALWYVLFPIIIFLTIISTIAYCPYKLRQLSNLAAGTNFGELSFKFDPRLEDFVWLVLGNTLMRIFTLNMVMAFAQYRVFRFVADNLQFIGKTDLTQIMQSKVPRARSGEGAAEVLDIDVF